MSGVEIERMTGLNVKMLTVTSDIEISAPVVFDCHLEWNR